MCRHLGVSSSGYYEWHDREPGKRWVANQVLTERIRQIHERSDSTYGAPRIHFEFIDMGERIGKNRIARLMKEARICGVRVRTPSDDALQRSFEIACTVTGIIYIFINHISRLEYFIICLTS